MKVFIVFCLLAIYGAVADDDSTEYEYETEQPSDKGMTIEGLLDLEHDMVHAGLVAGSNAFGKGIGLVNGTMVAATDMVADVMGNVTSLAGHAIEMSQNIGKSVINKAEDITNKTMDFVSSIPVFGKIVPGGLLKGVTGKVFGLTHKGVELGHHAAKTGVHLTNKVGQTVVAGVSKGAVAINDAMVTGEKAANAIASNVATASFKGMSSTVSKLRSKLSRN